MLLPIQSKFKITATFGQTGKHWVNGHKGIDIVSDDRNVRSVCDGTIRVVAYDPDGWGNYITIGDANGNIHVYCHLAVFPVLSSKKVKAGQVIGIMGTTGNSTGVHLHYQVNNSKGIPQNPALFLGIPNKVGEYGEETNMSKFTDIKRHYAEEYINEAANMGIVNGVGNNRFDPDAPLTRGQACIIIIKAIRYIISLLK